MAKLIWQAEAVHFNWPGAAECSSNEGSGDAGTSHNVKYCVCFLVWVSAELALAYFAAERTRVLALLSYKTLESFPWPNTQFSRV